MPDLPFSHQLAPALAVGGAVAAITLGRGLSHLMILEESRVLASRHPHILLK